MTHREFALMIAAATGLFLGISTVAMAQTAGPELIAPGLGLPEGSVGGVSPQNIPIAPGAATQATEQIGPGGIRLAPGTTGSAGVPLVTTPLEPVAPRTRRR